MENLQKNMMDALSWQSIARLLRILVPLLLVLAAVLWLLYLTEVRSLQTVVRSDQRHVIQLARQMIDAELDIVRGDTLFLADLGRLRQWLKSADPVQRDLLSSDMLAFALYREHYDQIRYIDESGREQLRINWRNGKPRAIPEAELQDKSERYYVKQTLALDKGEVFVSPFDLNVENNVIEQPRKPVIRPVTNAASSY